MRLWETHMQTLKPMPSFPYPLVVTREIQEAPTYFLEGRKRVGSKGGQLVCVLEGVGGFRLDGVDYRLTPGRAFLALHADPRHAYYYPPEATGPWIFLWMDMYGETAEKMIADMNARYGYLYDASLDGEVVSRLLSYENGRFSVRSLTSAASAKLVIDILAGVGDAAERQSEELDPARELATRAQRLMLESQRTAVTVETIAERLGVSREHLTRVFSEQIGESPRRYLTFRRIRRACELLRETTLSVKEVAVRSGYDTPTSFTRVFKQTTGLTPKEFRAVGYAPPFY